MPWIHILCPHDIFEMRGSCCAINPINKVQCSSVQYSTVQRCNTPVRDSLQMDTVTTALLSK